MSGHDGNPVTVSVGGVNANEVVETNGNWTATFAPNALDGLAEGDTAFTVSTEDDAGNTISADSDTVTVDLTPPTVDEPIAGVSSRAMTLTGLITGATGADGRDVISGTGEAIGTGTS